MNTSERLPSASSAVFTVLTGLPRRLKAAATLASSDRRKENRTVLAPRLAFVAARTGLTVSGPTCTTPLWPSLGWILHV